MDEGLLLRMLKGIATRNYKACSETVPQAFGLSSAIGVASVCASDGTEAGPIPAMLPGGIRSGDAFP